MMIASGAVLPDATSQSLLMNNQQQSKLLRTVKPTPTTQCQLGVVGI